ncbi:MAG: hypothetical protein IKA41_07305 [Bacteroidaceae bacterium]|nr:hypothetical protein [Bacteroidaceae bacterium]
MASRKDLKKVIAYISDELATEAFYLSYGSKGSTEEWVEVFNRIFTMQNDYTSRVSHVEPGLPARKYFDTLCISFNEDAKAVLDEIHRLSEKN